MMPFLKLDGAQLLRHITDMSSGALNDIIDGFADVGKGVGAIMLLVVLFYYITSLLDGGKFQIKMLVPLLIFFFVCNFSWISTPVTWFTTTLTESLVDACHNKRNEIKESMGGSATATYHDLTNRQINKNLDPKKEAEFVKARLDGRDTLLADESPKLRGIPKAVKRGVMSSGAQASYNMQLENSGESYNGMDYNDSSKNKQSMSNFSFHSIMSSVLSAICGIMSVVLGCFGAIMAGIIVAFGPITFAFAIFPGQGGTIKSWFIRLCQFSLWAPLCALIDVFCTSIFSLASNSPEMGGAGSFLLAIAMAVCNLVALTSVPSIASMVIEGAQGAISLSQGLQQMAGALTTVGGIGKMATVGAAGTLLGKQNVADTLTGFANSGIAGTVSQLGKVATGQQSFRGMMSSMRQHGQRTRNLQE